MLPRIIVLAFVILLTRATESAGASIYLVTLDTSALIGTPGLSLDFQFVDGDGIQNNSVVLTDFDFGVGGTVSGSASLLGGATGDVSTAVTLTDLNFFNAFTQAFTPGSLLTFTLSLTTNGLASPAPDRFAFSILDLDGFPLPTTGLADEFIGVDLLVPLFLSASGTDRTRTAFDVNAPTAQAVEAVPEPASLLLLIGGLGAMAAGRAGRRRIR